MCVIRNCDSSSSWKSNGTTRRHDRDRDRDRDRDVTVTVTVTVTLTVTQDGNIHQYNTKHDMRQQVEQKKLKPMVAIAAGVGDPAIKAPTTGNVIVI